MECGNFCSYEVFIVYCAVLSTVNLVVILVVVVGACLLFKRYRRVRHQLGLSNGAFRKANNNDCLVDGIGDLPLLTISREAAAEEVSADSLQAEERESQDRPLSDPAAKKKKETSPDVLRRVGREHANTMGTSSGKFGRSLSMPRILKKPTKDAKPAGGHLKSMKLITSELNQTEKFQRTSAESDELVPDAAVGSSAAADGGRLDGQQTACAPASGGAPRIQGNEYQVTVLSGEEDPSHEQPDNPYYFKLLPGEGGPEGSEDDEDIAKLSDGQSRIRGRRSMSDSAHLYSFPLKKTADKGRNALAIKKQLTSAARLKSPCPASRRVEDPSSTEGEYEPITQSTDREHSVVVSAEPPGEYSKLIRKMVKEEPASSEGYDRLTQPDVGVVPKTPTSGITRLKLSKESH